MRFLKKSIHFMVIISIIVMSLSSAGSLKAATAGEVQAYNIAGNALSTLLRGVLQGNVKNVKDAAKMLLVGGAAGYGFYQAKAMVGKGNVFPGVLLANFSASVTENVALGNNPLSHISYSFGPVRVSLATPLNRRGGALITTDLSPKDILSLALAFTQADKIRIKNGLFGFEADEKMKNGAIGWNLGLFPTIVTGTKDYVYNHEVIHVVQNLQFMAASYEPYARKEDTKKTLFKFDGLRFQLFSIAADLSMSQFSYENNLKEIEAFFFSGH